MHIDNFLNEIFYLFKNIFNYNILLSCMDIILLIFIHDYNINILLNLMF